MVAISLAAKPIKSLELHYTMIQFLIIKIAKFVFGEGHLIVKFSARENLD